jgi:hypothetical protein
VLGDSQNGFSMRDTSQSAIERGRHTLEDPVPPFIMHRSQSVRNQGSSQLMFSAMENSQLPLQRFDLYRYASNMPPAVRLKDALNLQSHLISLATGYFSIHSSLVRHLPCVARKLVIFVFNSVAFSIVCSGSNQDICQAHVVPSSPFGLVKSNGRTSHGQG